MVGVLRRPLIDEYFKLIVTFNVMSVDKETTVEQVKELLTKATDLLTTINSLCPIKR